MTGIRCAARACGFMLLAVALFASRRAPAQSAPAAPPAGPNADWWRAARFGLFVHWGPVSLNGTEIGWSRGGERRGTGGTGEVPVEVYDNFYKRFNPTAFDADEWVAVAREAGTKYLVFTTRHHDGFSMFDSQFTDYKITSPDCPFRRDVVKELAAACHRAGLHLGLYYSQPDWHHPDYRTPNHARYLKYLHSQVRELCTNYGKVDVLWFDGLGGTAADWDAENLLRVARQLQPGILINDRCGLPADFATPEQEVGRFRNDRPWESCITIGQQWAWKPDDELKSLRECVHTLVRCAGGDGNLLLNVGPMPDGRIEPRQVERLRQIGQWLKRCGTTIYDTRGGPYKPDRWGACTSRGSTVYLHVLDSAVETLDLPPLPKKIVASRASTGEPVRVSQTEAGLQVALGKPCAAEDLDRIIVLELDGPAAEMPVLPGRRASRSLALGRPATASNVFEAQAAFGPDKAFDDDEGTRWATDYGTHAAWLQVDLGTPQSIGQAILCEEYGRRVQEFELQVQDGEAWRTFARGKEIGPELRVTFSPVTARIVRLNILSATEGPTLSEFELLPP